MRALTVAGAVLMATFVLWPAAAQDQAEQPIARARVTPDAVVTVGQPVTVEVEVLVPTFFSGAPRFPDLDVADALVIFNDRGRNISERRGGRSWAGQSRSYTIYPQRAGTYEIPRIDVEVRYSAGGANRTSATVSPQPVRFEATVPAAAEGLGYFIATTGLTLDEKIEAAQPQESTEVLTLRRGDSFTRTITVTVQDALSMVVPPLDLGAPEGLATYPAQPVVEDTGGDRGEPIVGTRVESTTFVATEEGRYRLPTVELAWWDVAAEELRTAGAEAIDIEVVANPDLVTEFVLPVDDEEMLGGETAPGTRISLVEYARRYGMPVLAMLLVAYGVTRLARRPGLDIGRLLHGDPDVQEEVRLFRDFCEAARSHRGADTARAFMRWLDRWNRRPGTYAEFSAAAADADMDREARALGASLYARPAAEPISWSGPMLARNVERARRRARKKEAAEERPPLPPLNP